MRPFTRLLALPALVLSTSCSSGSSGAADESKGGNDAGTGGSASGRADASGPVGNTTGSGGTATGGAGASRGGASAHAGNTSATASGGATNTGGRTSTTGAAGKSGGTGAAGAGGAGCTGVGTACDSAVPQCCSGLICVSSTGPDYAGCRKPCTTASDCDTGCCIPFANIPDKGFCADALLCQCAGANETCGGARSCCDGFTCTTYDSTNKLACMPKCTKNSDCATNCCIAIPTTPDSACFMPSWCGK